MLTWGSTRGGFCVRWEKRGVCCPRRCSGVDLFFLVDEACTISGKRSAAVLRPLSPHSSCCEQEDPSMLMTMPLTAMWPLSLRYVVPRV